MVHIRSGNFFTEPERDASPETVSAT
jgi:hypothetical protein